MRRLQTYGCTTLSKQSTLCTKPLKQQNLTTKFNRYLHTQSNTTTFSSLKSSLPSARTSLLAVGLLGFATYVSSLWGDNDQSLGNTLFLDSAKRRSSAERYIHETEDAGEYEREDVPTSVGSSSTNSDSPPPNDASGQPIITDPDSTEITIVESEVTEIGPDGKTRKRKRRRKCQFIDEDEELLHLEFLKLQEWLRETKKRVLVMIEGRDTAGQGGAIRYYTLHLNPKFYRVVTFKKPTDREKGEWYFQRYIAELPDPGQIVFFYHSWYNRAIVEPVMNYCSESQYKKFTRDVVLLEEMLKDDGLIIVKFWFSITKDIQAQRLRAPVHNPLKRWKMKPASDWRILTMFHLISKFRDQMFLSSSTDSNPWVIVSGLSKSKARKESLKYVLNMIPYKGKENAKVDLNPDPNVVMKAETHHVTADDFEMMPVQQKRKKMSGRRGGILQAIGRGGGDGQTTVAEIAQMSGMEGGTAIMQSNLESNEAAAAEDKANKEHGAGFSLP